MYQKPYIKTLINWNFAGEDWAFEISAAAHTVKETENELVCALRRLIYARKRAARPALKYIYSVTPSSSGALVRMIIKKTNDPKADNAEIKRCFCHFSGRVTAYKNVSWFKDLPTERAYVGHRAFNASHNLKREYSILTRRKPCNTLTMPRVNNAP